MNILNEKSKIEKYHAFHYIFLTGLGASANFGVFRRLLASTINGSGRVKNLDPTPTRGKL